ncbi:hypothetical protein AVEN_5019-1 [Araneus ventricosus]|uniref:Uncharacterized protein n=1 Tax=Araneus ventricosus TaxID=182803 RepID=A0A4Y2PZ68_ARAVE|nr:hypothetical protein AVEN_268215-1 [Araneus ventricosus]GBN57188.1 hypothetical protein AVEN_5019-1 [Araneus ventricosus]
MAKSGPCSIKPKQQQARILAKPLTCHAKVTLKKNVNVIIAGSQKPFSVFRDRSAAPLQVTGNSMLESQQASASGLYNLAYRIWILTVDGRQVLRLL